MDKTSQDTHLNLQQRYFSQRVSSFSQDIPQDVKQRLEKIVNLSKLKSSHTVLDVATGTGVLIEYFLKLGVSPKNIVGIDLTHEMLSQASSKYPEVAFCNTDFLKFGPESDFILNNNDSEKVNLKFNQIYFNACFGNFLNQKLVIKKAKSLLKSRGKIIISHPLGKKFVAQLNMACPEIVPNLLPDQEKLLELASQFNLDINLFDDCVDFYIAILQKL